MTEYLAAGYRLEPHLGTDEIEISISGRLDVKVVRRSVKDILVDVQL